MNSVCLRRWWKKPRCLTIFICRLDTQTVIPAARHLSIMVSCRAKRRSLMPVRSLNSRVLRWPNADVVIGAARNWATALGRARKDVIRIGYIGSYARGDWGVGSDLDLVIVTDEANAPFHER